MSLKQIHRIFLAPKPLDGSPRHVPRCTGTDS
jgi:hypothetical protein